MRSTSFQPQLLPAISGGSSDRWLAVLSLVILVCVVSPAGNSTPHRRAAEMPANRDLALLDEMERRAIRYFIEQSDPQTGLTLDRADADGRTTRELPASIAATGFALTGWCVADARGWTAPGEALARVRTTLRFVAGNVAHERGWLYHFVNARTGARAWRSEASTIDTALFLCGALAAREYFNDTEVTEWVDEIYARIDWRWAMNGGSTLTHGWKPESGFISARWDQYSELMGLYLLGIGAPMNALPPAAWNAWERGPVVTYRGRTFLDCGTLFTHQYAHAWFDFRGVRDGHTDYWRNSTDATLAQRDWSAAQGARFPQWSRDLWGLTASDSARGYVAWGGPVNAEAHAIDGTLVPCAPAGSLPFAPRECLEALHRMREVGGERVWRRYGFVDAFNPHNDWVSPDVIGIDVGIGLVMAENVRSGLVWQIFMAAPEVRRAMRLAGFREDAPRFVAGGTSVARAD